MNDPRFYLFHDESDDFDTNGWYARRLDGNGQPDPDAEVIGPHFNEDRAREAVLAVMVRDQLQSQTTAARQIVAEAAIMLSADRFNPRQRAEAALQLLGYNRCCELLGYDPVAEDC